MSSIYKVLPLSFPFNVDREAWDYWEIESVLKDPNYIKIEPILNRNGWYYNRITKKSWIECQYGCLEEKKSDMFLYHLKIKDHSPLPAKVRKAIKILMSYNACPKKLKEKLFLDDEIKMIEDTRRGSGKWALKYRKETEENELVD